MKSRLKRFFSLSLVCLLVGIAGLGLTGCSKEEVKENTIAGVEATTSIVPFEYSKETAVTMYLAALSRAVDQNVVLMETKTMETDTSANIIKETPKHYLIVKNVSGTTVTHKNLDITDRNNPVDLNNNTSWINFYAYASKVVGGRYYDGENIISVVRPDEHNEYCGTYVDIYLKDGMISKVLSTVVTETGEMNIFEYAFSYNDLELANEMVAKAA